jgi:NAD-dependent dihydropyrimidine dehydrogenase PreA subunit
MALSYTIVAHTCEGLGDCIAVCPVECIHWVEGKTNDKGTKFVYIDASMCIDCGACLSICPIEGAILDQWKPELQQTNAISHSYSQFEKKWRTEKVMALARQLLNDGAAEGLPKLADALKEAGCSDSKLLEYCRDPQAGGSPTREAGEWVARVVLGE